MRTALMVLIFASFSFFAVAENTPDNSGSFDSRPSQPAQPSERTSNKNKESRKYFNDDSKRVDAGVFHVGFAGGGNFYMEPKKNSITKAPIGEYFKDFGFQVGVYFDHDYSELDENIPLALRGMVGYKYILNSVHVFAFDGVVRRMFRFSEKACFGIGGGGSIAVWNRVLNDFSNYEETLLLPSFILTAGFEFSPFMIDLKGLVNKFGADATIMGFELYFGFRL